WAFAVGPCTVDGDCDDDNPCTFDTCLSSGCNHWIVPDERDDPPELPDALSGMMMEQAGESHGSISSPTAHSSSDSVWHVRQSPPRELSMRTKSRKAGDSPWRK